MAQKEPDLLSDSAVIVYPFSPLQPLGIKIVKWNFPSDGFIK